MAADSLFVKKAGYLYEEEGGGGDEIVALENPDADIAWYAQYFVRNEHFNYICDDPQLGAVAVSTVREEDGDSYSYRIIVRTKKTNERVRLASEKKKLGLSDLLKAVRPEYGRLAKKLVPVANVAMFKELLAIESLESITQYKFGVLLVKEGQTDEEDMFSNEHATPAFEEFLDCIGEKIELLGWDKYKAGLDVKMGGTGTHSYYTTLQDIEVMFHVTTCLPFTSFNKQQLQRKRQCGNDVCMIMFIDGKDTPFDTECIASHFNHVWAVVQPSSASGTHYRVAVARKDNVPYFGPALPENAILSKQELGAWLVTKMINGERSAMNSDVFIQLTERTKELMLNGLLTDFADNRSTDKAKKDAILAQVEAALAKGPGAAKKRNDVDVFSNFKVAAGIPADTTCGGVYEHTLIYGTDEGLFSADLGEYEVRSVSTRQLESDGRYSHVVVIEELGVAVVVCGKKAELAMYHVPALLDPTAPSGRLPLGVKKVAVLTTGRIGSSAYLAAGAGKTVHVFRWSAGAFHDVARVAMPADVRSLAFCGAAVVVGFRNQYDLLDLTTSTLSELYRSEDKLVPTFCVPVGPAVLLGLNHNGLYVNLAGELVPGEPELAWAAAPSVVVYRAPYLIGLTGAGAEIRSRATGRLMQTLDLPGAVVFAADADNIVVGARAGPAAATLDVFRIAVRTAAADYSADLAVLSEAGDELLAALSLLDSLVDDAAGGGKAAGKAPADDGSVSEAAVAATACLDALL